MPVAGGWRLRPDVGRHAGGASLGSQDPEPGGRAAQRPCDKEQVTRARAAAKDRSPLVCGAGDGHGHDKTRAGGEVAADDGASVGRAGLGQPRTSPSIMTALAPTTVTRACSGLPPMAATSLTLTASDFQPTSAAVTSSRSKWTPSTTASAARSRGPPTGPATTAASSPIHVSPSGGGGKARLMVSIAASSPLLADTTADATSRA